MVVRFTRIAENDAGEGFVGVLLVSGSKARWGRNGGGVPDSGNFSMARVSSTMMRQLNRLRKFVEESPGFVNHLG